ncbi:helix-turn-helix transcriptional regulator [Rothia terrae]|uniref:helix-turn-helix transcriptional regulator n=1 Tax=Rothia terrae TaxID=396015 RepID=UPI00380A97ED
MDVLSITDLCTRWQVSRTTIHNISKTLLPPSFYIGRFPRWYLRDVQAYEQTHH